MLREEESSFEEELVLRLTLPEFERVVVDGRVVGCGRVLDLVFVLVDLTLLSVPVVPCRVVVVLVDEPLVVLGRVVVLRVVEVFVVVLGLLVVELLLLVLVGVVLLLLPEDSSLLLRTVDVRLLLLVLLS